MRWQEQDVPLDALSPTIIDDRGVDLPLGPMLDEALAEGGALLLLDGLDEVRDLAQRQPGGRAGGRFFHLSPARRATSSSSPAASWATVRCGPSSRDWPSARWWILTRTKSSEFVDKWTAALERAARGDTPVAAEEAEREQEELLAAVHRNPGVRRLAANPLLLTILALMKRQGVTLPERRVELYQKYVETLLKHWNLARGLGRPPSRDLDVVETVRVLAPLALWMHETSPGVGLVKREAVRRKLEEIYAERGAVGPGAGGPAVAGRRPRVRRPAAGAGRGRVWLHPPDLSGVPGGGGHRPAGAAGVEPVVEALAAHVGDDNWHEVSLLTIGYMGIVQQRDEAARRRAVAMLIQDERPANRARPPCWPERRWWTPGPAGVTPACKSQVVAALVETMTDDGASSRRARRCRAAPWPSWATPAEVMTDESHAVLLRPPGPFWMGRAGGAPERPTGLWLLDRPIPCDQCPVSGLCGRRGYQDAAVLARGDCGRRWKTGLSKAVMMTRHGQAPRLR